MGWGWLKSLFSGLLGFFKDSVEEDWQEAQASKAQAKEKQLESSAKTEREQEKLEKIVHKPPKRVGMTDLDDYVRRYRR